MPASSIIPIENVYYLLCYAWDKLDEKELTGVSLTPMTRLQDLFGRVLTTGVTHLLKRGIDRSYISREDSIPGVRGRLDTAGSLKRATFVNARAMCIFDELSPDVLHNQIIKTTLRRLASVRGLDKELAESLRGLYRRMPDVGEIAITDQVFRRITLGRNTSYYGFLLDICEIVHRNLLVHESTGETVFRDFTRDDAQMARLFEKFLRRFFKREQHKYSVHAPRLTWHAEGDLDSLALLPDMQTDIVLTGSSRTIVMDAKYYAQTLGEYWSKSSLRPGHLYQLLAYLNHIGDRGRRACGVLIYPRTTNSVRVRLQLVGYPFVAATLNLAQPWPQIHNDLLEILSEIEAIAA